MPKIGHPGTPTGETARDSLWSAWVEKTAGVVMKSRSRFGGATSEIDKPNMTGGIIVCKFELRLSGPNDTMDIWISCWPVGCHTKKHVVLHFVHFAVLGSRVISGDKQSRFM